MEPQTGNARDLAALVASDTLRWEPVIKAIGDQPLYVGPIGAGTVAKLAHFTAKEGLTFPLLSDESLDVHNLYGSYGTKTLYGREYEGVLRSTFVIDEKGKVEHALYNVKATGHVASLRKLLEV